MSVAKVTFSKNDTEIIICDNDNKKLKTTQIVREALQSLNLLNNGEYSFDLNTKTITNNLTSKNSIFINITDKEKIIKACQRQYAFEIATQPKPCNNSKVSENRIKKLIVNSVDSFFRKRIIHAKLADIATLLLFAATIAICIISIHTGSLVALNFLNNNLMPYCNIAFATTTSSVGIVLFYQSILNYQKAKKANNKEEMRLAIAQAIFSLVIIGVGSMGILSAMNISNKVIIRTLFGMCSSYMFGLGIYNLRKTLILRKKFQEKKDSLNDLLKELLEIQEKEQLVIEDKINNLNDNEINNWLKKISSNEQFENLKSKNIEEKKQYISQKELEMLQQRKLSYFESIVGKSILKECIEFLNGQSNIQENDLKEKLNKALNRKLFAESFRIIAPILGISAFGLDLGFNLNLFNNMSKNLETLIYTSIMFANVLIAAPLNYSKKDRNVPTEEDEDLSRKSVRTTSVN